MPAKPAFAAWNNNTNASWWKDKGLRRMVVHISILYCCIFTFGYDGSLLNGLQTIPRWQADFDSPVGSDLGLIGASFYLPKIVSPTISAMISDRFGRRMALLVGSVVSVGGALLNTFAHAHNRGMLMAGRAVLGFGLGMQAPIAPAMIQELCHPRMRAVAGAMYLTFFYVGSTLSAWLCFGMIGWNDSWAWRLPTLIQAFGTGTIGLYIICGLMVESPRWLVSVGKDEQALKVLAKMHANGDENDELVQAEMHEITEGFKLDQRTSTSYLSYLRTHGNRKRLLVLVVTAAAGQLNGVGLLSYYLAPILRLIGITAPVQQAGINGGLAIFNLFTTVAFAQFVERIGRRPLWLTGSVGLLCTFAIITGLSGSFANNPVSSIGTAVIPFFYVFYFFNNMAWATLANLYTAEILPFALRSKGLSIYVTTQSVSLAFNQYVNPVALAALAWKYYLVYIAVQVGLVAFAYFFYPETKGYTIEEVSRLFDGAAAASAVAEQAMAGSEHEESVSGKKAETEEVETVGGTR